MTAGNAAMIRGDLIRVKRTLLAAGLVAAALGLSACGSDPTPAPPAATAPAADLVTVTVGGAMLGSIAYTDPTAPQGVGHLEIGSDAKAAKTTVPRGSTVLVQGTAPGPGEPVCWISDATDQLTFTRGTDTCQAVIS